MLWRSVPASFYIFALLVFASAMLSTQYVYILPGSSAFSSLKVDFAYHAGIINALMLGYPPQDPWVAGLGLDYHFFSEMLLSIPAELFDMPSDQLLMSGMPFVIAFIFPVALYSFFREFSVMKDRAGLYCLAFHLSNMFMLKQFAYSWFLYHLYSNVNNAGLGIACFLTILPLVKEWDRDPALDKPKFNVKELLLLAVLVMLMTGIKGPISAVFVGGIAGTLILGLILRKIDLRSLALAVLSGISFLLIYVYVLGAEHSNTTGGSVLNLGEVTDIFFLKDNVMRLGLPRSASLLVLMGIFLVFYLTAFFFPFIIGYIREFIFVITGRKDFIFSRINIYACCMVGFLGMMVTDFNGHSQVYFGFAASVLVPVIAFWFFEDVHDSKGTAVRLVRYAFALCMCMSVITSAIYLLDSAERSIGIYESRDDNVSKYRNVSAAEYEGLLWMEENTPDDALVASDRYYSVAPDKYSVTSRGSNTHFAYAVYSERRQYIEGSGFSIGAGGYERRRNMLKKLREMYDPANDARGDAARELGVDYLIVSKRFDDVGDLTNEDLEICYSNEDMDIYKIKEAG